MGLWPTLTKAFELRPVMSLNEAIGKRRPAYLLTLRREAYGSNFKLVATTTWTAIRHHCDAFRCARDSLWPLSISITFPSKPYLMGRLHWALDRFSSFFIPCPVNRAPRIPFITWSCEYS